MSLCLPIHSGSSLNGVACVDARIDDIFFNVTYYQGGVDSYVFIIDSHGRTILHPMLPKPRAWQEDSVFIDISTLERGDQHIELINSMKRCAYVNIYIHFVFGFTPITPYIDSLVQYIHFLFDFAHSQRFS